MVPNYKQGIFRKLLNLFLSPLYPVDSPHSTSNHFYNFLVYPSIVSENGRKYTHTHIPHPIPSIKAYDTLCPHLVLSRNYILEITPVFLPGKSHGRRSLVGYGPWGRKELDATYDLWLTLFLSNLLSHLIMEAILLPFSAELT